MASIIFILIVLGIVSILWSLFVGAIKLALFIVAIIVIMGLFKYFSGT